MITEPNPTESNLSAPLIVERTFQAPVSQVWHALTNVEAMRVWYFDLKEFRPEPGFEFQFTVEHQGRSYDHRCQVTEVVPERKLAYSWRYHEEPGDSLVTVELFPEGTATRLRLTHTGLHTFPALPTYARENFQQGWNHIIGEALREYVEKPALSLTVQREFKAPVDLVWQTWTQPGHLQQWLAGDPEMTLESVVMDLREGGKFRIQQRMADGEYYTAAGTYLEVKPGAKLVHTWDWEKDGSGPEFGELEGKETRVTVEFQAHGADRTLVVLTHANFAAEKSRDGHREGWTKWLEKAAAFMESQR